MPVAYTGTLSGARALMGHVRRILHMQALPVAGAAWAMKFTRGRNIG